MAGDDKIQRLIQNGPEDVVDRVYEVLLHAGEWGQKSEDSFGKRITLKSPEVREKLELRRDESLQSKQVRDVFEKIVDLAADSPRKVKTTKNQEVSASSASTLRRRLCRKCQKYRVGLHLL